MIIPNWLFAKIHAKYLDDKDYAAKLSPTLQTSEGFRFQASRVTS